MIPLFNTIWYAIKNWFYMPQAPVFEVGDGVRITANLEEQFIGQVGTVVGIVSTEPSFDEDGELVPETGCYGPYKINVRTLYSWAYCTGWQLEKLTASERLYYGV